MHIEERSGIEIGSESRSDLLADPVGRLSSFRQGVRTEQRGFGLGPRDERSTLADRFVSPIHALLELDVSEAVEASYGRVRHPLRDVVREIRNVRNAPHAPDRSWLRRFDR